MKPLWVSVPSSVIQKNCSRLVFPKLCSLGHEHSLKQIFYSLGAESNLKSSLLGLNNVGLCSSLNKTFWNTEQLHETVRDSVALLSMAPSPHYADSLMGRTWLWQTQASLAVTTTAWWSRVLSIWVTLFVIKPHLSQMSARNFHSYLNGQQCSLGPSPN